MGQVWKARDTRLGRMVARKTFAVKFSERFEGKSRAVAALNYPHICTLYDVGPYYLAMEYVEGAGRAEEVAVCIAVKESPVSGRGRRNRLPHL
jgi:serine/threonine protein kinase